MVKQLTGADITDGIVSRQISQLKLDNLQYSIHKKPQNVRFLYYSKHSTNTSCLLEVLPCSII
jgi:hypothetical protein